MKMVLLCIFMFLTIFSISAYGGVEELPERYINGKVSNIVETYIYNRGDSVDTAIVKRAYRYLSNGLIFIDSNIKHTNNDIQYRHDLFYNETFDERMINANKLNERLYLGQYSSYLIHFNENENSISMGYTRAILTFNNINRLNTFRGWNGRNSNFEFEYDETGRLTGIYTLYFGKRIQKRAVFYDGTLRLIEKPFYEEDFHSDSPYYREDMYSYHTNPLMKRLEEIIIYDGDILKYIVVLNMERLGDVGSNWTLNELERRHFNTIYEYDNNLNLLQWSHVYDDDYAGRKELLQYKYRYLEFDNYNNWSHRTMIENSNGEETILNEVIREIEYER